MALSTLASETVLTQECLALSDDVFLLSADLMVSLYGHTSGEGPLLVGLANDLYSVTEVKEAINAAPTKRSDVIQLEHQRRKVRKIGLFHGNNTEEVLNDGKPIRVPIKFGLGASDDLNMFVMNMSGAALTTGSFVRLVGQAYGKWA